MVNRYDAMDTQEIEERIDAAGSAYAAWQQIKMNAREAYLCNAAAILEKNKQRYAGLMALEMGKPIREGRAEIEKCAWLCRHVAKSAAQMLAPEIVQTDARKSFVTFPPLGVVLGVMPWNYSFWQVFRFAAPSLMAGNAVLLKHASNVPGCSQAIEAVMHEAGFPPTLFQALLISSEQVVPVIDHPSVKAVALTGSNAAGQAVAARAGKQIKPTVLELGGSDPYLILADANLDLAVDSCAAGRLLNSGQSCIAAKRLEAGNCFVNAFVKSDPRLPFGGIKQSGYGRELSHYGIKSFVNIKTVYVAKG